MWHSRHCRVQRPFAHNQLFICLSTGLAGVAVSPEPGDFPLVMDELTDVLPIADKHARLFHKFSHHCLNGGFPWLNVPTYAIQQPALLLRPKLADQQDGWSRSRIAEQKPRHIVGFRRQTGQQLAHCPHDLLHIPKTHFREVALDAVDDLDCGHWVHEVAGAYGYCGCAGE